MALRSIPPDTVRGRLHVPEKNEGLVGVPQTVDFSNAQDITYDFSLLHSNNQFSVVRTLMLDNSSNPSPVYISVNNTGQKLTWPPYSLGALPISALADSQIRFVTAGGGDATKSAFTYIEFFNYDIPPFMTSAFGPITPGQINGIYGIDGSHVMSLSNPLAVTPGQVTTYTNRNTQLVANTAANVFPGGGAAVQMQFANLDGDDVWYNFGVTATASFAAGDNLLVGGASVLTPFRYSGRVSFISTGTPRIQAKEIS